jgi:hypothetical protein
MVLWVCTNPYVSLTHSDGIAWQAPLTSRQRDRLQGVLLRLEIALSNVSEVSNEVVHQQRSYIVLGVGRIRITCGCTGYSGSTNYDRGRGRQ